MLLDYLRFQPSHGERAEIAETAALIGRTRAGCDLVLRNLATLHIADGLIPSAIGNQVTIGKYALVHACTLEDGVVVGDAAVVMDGARVGAYAVLAAGSLVPPRKELQGGFLYDGNPAAPVR